MGLIFDRHDPEIGGIIAIAAPAIDSEVGLLKHSTASARMAVGRQDT